MLFHLQSTFSLACAARSTVYLPCLQRCRPKRTKKTHSEFRSHADGLASLEDPSIPVATSGPAHQFQPYCHEKTLFLPLLLALSDHTVKQQHLTLPETRILKHTSGLSATAAVLAFESRQSSNISWCAHRCVVRIHTSSAAALACSPFGASTTAGCLHGPCPSPLHSSTTFYLTTSVANLILAHQSVPHNARASCPSL